MKKSTFFLSCFLGAFLLLLLVVVIGLAVGYRFSVYHANDETYYFFGKKEEGTVYYAQRQADYVPGELRFSDGDVYKGEIEDYLPNGEGVYTRESGEKVTGRFDDGRPDGLCTVEFVDGSHMETTFSKGVPQGEASVTIVYDDGSADTLNGKIFSAFFAESVAYFYRNGTNYEGGYNNSRVEVWGTLTFADNSRYEGGFLLGEPSGYGTYTFPDGSVYRGDFAEGLPQGQGTYTYSENGIVREVTGEFYRGVLISSGSSGEEEAGGTTP